MKIAVFLGKDNNTASIYDVGIINVYDNENGYWHILKTIDFKLSNTGKFNIIRENIISIANSLKGCKVFIGKEVTGLLFNVLENKGFNIWEMEGKPEQFLDYVYYKEKEELNKEEKNEVIPFPIKKSENGCYFINLKKAQENNKGISSKQILIPFLKNTPFYELEIQCSHVPGWFENGLDCYNVEKEVIKYNEKDIKIFVRKKVCG